MARVCTPCGRTKKHKLLSSLPRMQYGFKTELERLIVTWARNKVDDLKKNSQTVTREWKQRCERMEDAEPSSNEHFHVLPSALPSCPNEQSTLLRS